MCAGDTLDVNICHDFKNIEQLKKDLSILLDDYNFSTRPRDSSWPFMYRLEEIIRKQLTSDLYIFDNKIYMSAENEIFDEIDEDYFLRYDSYKNCYVSTKTITDQDLFYFKLKYENYILGYYDFESKIDISMQIK